MRRSTSPVQYASLSADNRSFSTGSLMSNGRSHRPEGEQREPLVRCTAWFGGASSRRLRPPALCITGITVDPQILRQGKLVNLEVEVVRRSQRHPPQRGGFVVLHGALPSQDREVVSFRNSADRWRSVQTYRTSRGAIPNSSLSSRRSAASALSPGSTWPPGRATAPGTTLFVGFRSSARTVAPLRTRAATHSMGCLWSVTLRLSLTPLLPKRSR
jgi:hypothetical protein